MDNSAYFTTQQRGQAIVFTWKPDVDEQLSEWKRVQTELLGVIAKAHLHSVVIDFTHLALCRSSLIGILVTLRNHTDQIFQLGLCEISPYMLDKFRQLKLDQVFDIYPTISEAVEACGDKTD